MKTLFTKKQMSVVLALLLTLSTLILPLMAAEPPAIPDAAAPDAAAPEGDVPAAAVEEELKESRIESAVILDSKTMLEVKVRLTADYLSTHEKTPLYLFELLPYQSTSALNDYEPVGMMAADKEVVFSVPFDNEELRVQAKYIAAEKRDDGTYAIVTKAAFIDNPEILAKYDTDYPTYPSKKGLAHPDNLTEVFDLGVSHAVLDVPVNEYIKTEAGADSVEYTFAGKPYYIDRVSLQLLDWKVGYLTDAGVHVYLNFLLTPPSAKNAEGLSCLYCEGASPDASYYALNTRNEDAVMYVTSFMSFMAKRYGNVKGDYGFAGSFIVGMNVNSNRYYHSMGEKDLSSFLDMYTTAFRIADTALRSVYKNGRCYVSVADNLNTAAIQPDGRANDKLDYSASDFLKLFDQKITMGGDIPWRVALNIRPTVKGQAEFWQSPNISDASSTPFVNLYNIGALTDLLKSEELLYQGSPRSVAVTSDAIPSDGSEQMQAAAFAYAYLTAACDESIECYAFARQTDSVADGSSYGLKKPDGTKKAVYDVFRSIDTNEWKSVVSPLTAALSVTDFSELIPSFDSATYKGGRTLIRGSALPEESIAKEYLPVDVVDFSAGDLALFEPSDNTEYIEPYRPENSEPDTPYVLYAKLASALSAHYAGISKVFPLGQSIADSRYLTLNLNVQSDSGLPATLMLVLSHGQNYTYKATANIPTNTAVTVSFDLQPILDGGFDVFHSLRLLVAPAEGSTVSGFYLGNIQRRVFTETDPMENLLVIAIVVVGIIICFAIVALVVIRIRTSRTGLVDSSYYEEETPAESAKPSKPQKAKKEKTRKEKPQKERTEKKPERKMVAPEELSPLSEQTEEVEKVLSVDPASLPAEETVKETPLTIEELSDLPEQQKELWREEDTPILTHIELHPREIGGGAFAPAEDELPETASIPVVEEMASSDTFPTAEDLPETASAPTVEEMASPAVIPAEDDLPDPTVAPVIEEVSKNRRPRARRIPPSAEKRAQEKKTEQEQ
ncbi:MAG: hypothetical protein E7655_08945 [Ruminococcaceae bacterium]|nr:hypothetical protein [Oscillospiraceae bacterium]